VSALSERKTGNASRLEQRYARAAADAWRLPPFPSLFPARRILDSDRTAAYGGGLAKGKFQCQVDLLEGDLGKLASLLLSLLLMLLP